MANLKAKDGDSLIKFLKAKGTGDDSDPLVIAHYDESAIDRLDLINDSLTIGNALSRAVSLALSDAIYTITSEAYYSSSKGGKTCYNVSSGVVSVPNTGVIPLVFVNPANSGMDAAIARIIISTDMTGRFERYRNGVVNPTGNSQTPVNRGGGNNMPKSMAYLGTAATASGGILSKIQYASADSEDVSRLDGSIILRPGQNMYWRFFPKASSMANGNSTIEVVWYESLNL